MNVIRLALRVCVCVWLGLSLAPSCHSVSSQGDKDMVHIASAGAYQGQSVAKGCTVKQVPFKTLRVCVCV